MEKESGDLNNVEVSVLCVTYNHKKYIKEAVDSFIMQKTNFRFEIIIHDDASTDGTSEILREYEKKYPNLIKVIYEEHNQYSQGNQFMMKMLDCAKGKYVANCDGDDFWVDRFKLQKQYDAMQKNKGISIVVGKTMCCEEDGGKNDSTIPSGQNNLIKDGIIENRQALNIILTEGYSFHTSTFFTKKSLQINCCLREFNKFMNGDESTLREAIIEGHFYYIGDILSCRRMNSINNYNHIFNNQSFKTQSLHYLGHLFGHIDFDKQTDREYHTMLSSYAERILPNVGFSDRKMFNEIRQHFDIHSYSILKKYGYKNYLKYACTIISPSLMGAMIISRLKHKNDRKK